MTYRTTTEKSWKALPDGEYQTEFRNVKEEKTKKGLALRWTFQVIDGGEYHGNTVSGLTGTSNPACDNQLGRYMSWLANEPLVAGLGVDDDDYIGHQYLVIVENGNVKIFSKM